MSFNNIFGRQVEASKFELEITIEMNIYEIKADNMKNINSLDIKISSIASNKTSSYS